MKAIVSKEEKNYYKIWAVWWAQFRRFQRPLQQTFNRDRHNVIDFLQSSSLGTYCSHIKSWWISTFYLELSS